MSIGKDRLAEFANIGSNQEVVIQGVERNVLLAARLVPINEVASKLQKFPDTPLIFSPHEFLYSRRMKSKPYDRFATRLAAKQLALGLVNNTDVGWRDIEVVNNEYNSPSLVLSWEAQRLVNEIGIRGIHVSLAHEQNTALAFGVAEKIEPLHQPKVIRVGTDIAPVEPFETPTVRTATFTEEEFEAARVQEFPARRLATYFAIKESVVKILEKLPGWIWKEIEIQDQGGRFTINLSGGAQERLEEMGATTILTTPTYKEGVGALAFSTAVTKVLDTQNNECYPTP